MTDLYLEDDFHLWPRVAWNAPGEWFQNGWRFLATGGAAASLQRIEIPEGAALRIARGNAEGDCALDCEGPDNRALVEPGEKLFVRFWARKVGGPASLEIRLTEYEGDTATGTDNPQAFALSEDFQPYSFQVALSLKTTEASLALRLQGTGTLELLRVELGPVEKASGEKPRILLPQGRTPNVRPTLWWRGPTPRAYQIQLAKDIRFAAVAWDSGVVERGGSHHALPELQEQPRVFARVRVQDGQGDWSAWSEPTLVVYSPLPQLEPGALVVYDLHPTRQLSPAEAFEQAHLVSALQGLVNRERPRLFLRWMEADDFWLERLRRPGRWLEQVTLETCPSLEDLLQKFSGRYQGVVLWDPAVPATSNVASTIAGVEELLPIPERDEPGSLYRRLVLEGPRLPVIRSLVDKFTGSGTIPDSGEPSSGSAKNDAYRWAIAKYLESGRCNPARLGYYMDAFWIGVHHLGGDRSNHTLTNHDFFIQHEGFLWDLHVWDDEAPNDDPQQPLGTDYQTLLRMLRAAAERLGPDEMIHCGGFTPWAFKYTDSRGVGGRHGGVPTEWETVRLLSAYNGFLDADALSLSGLANASVYSHMPRPARAGQPPPPLPEECKREGWLDARGRVAKRTFITHYVGDYDSAAWLTTQVPAMWEHFRRGQVTVPWAWNPNLMERGMPMFDEFIRSRTPRDFLWSGDSGAGYVAPTQLFDKRPPSGLPEAGRRWQRHCARWFRRLDVRHVGFIINGLAGTLTPEAIACFRPFTGDGIVARETEVEGIRLDGSMPVVEMGHNGLPGRPEPSAAEIARVAGGDAPRFLVARSILKGPEYYFTIERTLRRKHGGLRPALLDPGALFYLARHHLGGKNGRRAAFLDDTMPEWLRPGQSISGTVWLRNIGWDIWNNTGDSAVEVAVELAEADERQSPRRFPLPHPVEPGAMVEVRFSLKAPRKAGAYLWRIDLVQGRDGWFSDSGNLPDAREVVVAPEKEK